MYEIGMVATVKVSKQLKYFELIILQFFNKRNGQLLVVSCLF